MITLTTIVFTSSAFLLKLKSQTITAAPPSDLFIRILGTRKIEMKSLIFKVVVVFLIVLCNCHFGNSRKLLDESKKLNFAKFFETDENEEVNSLQDSDLDLLSRNLFGNRTINPTLFKLLISISPLKCANDLQYVLQNIKYLGWAAKMIDSYGKPESGILTGNIQWNGDYRECVNIYAPPSPNNSNVGDFRGSYCTLQASVNVTENFTLPLSSGICLPDSCVSPGMNVDLLELKDFYPEIDYYVEYVFRNLSLTCPPTKSITSGAIAVIFIISIFVLLALIGTSITAYEICTQEREGTDSLSESEVNNKALEVNKSTEQITVNDLEIESVSKADKRVLPGWLERCKEYFNCFCFLTNGEKLLNTDSSEGQLPSLHGIRFLSMSWVILCHSYSFSIPSTRNQLETVYVFDHWHFQIVLNGFYSVDSFFLLSGFLVAYLYFQEAEKRNGKISWAYFYIHRYLRLTPVYMIVLAFYAAMLQYLGSGPYWISYDDNANCKVSWWWNMLYINNFQGIVDQCMGWTWYLANDMQFYVISPLFLITLRRWPLKAGYWILALFLIISFAVNFAITYEYNLITGLGTVSNELSNLNEFVVKFNSFFDKLYIKPYSRISPYLIGIILAYYLFKIKQNKPVKHSWITLGCGWSLASVITLACLFGTYNNHIDLIGACFYNALNRTGFSIGLAWLIYVCLTGHGGFINKFLSWKFLIPLSRLTFCAYLIHPVIAHSYYQAMKTGLDFNNMTLVVHYIAFIVMGYISAFFISLLFESPLIRLEKIVRKTFSS